MISLYDYLSWYNIELTNDSGREIERFKAPFYTHTGIIIGRNRYSKEGMIFHNHPTTGPAIVTLSRFQNGYDARYTNRPTDDRDTVLMRSFRQLDRGASYTLPDYTCQDASSYARKGVAKSHGRSNTVGVLAFIGFLALLSGGNNNK